MSVGERLGEIRRGRGITQAEFAKNLGVSQPALAAYEKDVREPPLSAIIALCLNSNVSPEWILFGQGAQYRGREAELITKALAVTKRHLPKILPDATVEKEAEFASLIYQYLLENGEISNSMAEAVFRVGAAR